MLKQQADDRKKAMAEAMEVIKAAEAAQQSSESESEPEEAPRRKRMAIPDILPPEFLESDDEDGSDAMDLDMPRKPTKITFGRADRDLAKRNRAPADKKVGGTVYRVVADKTEKKLAPKVDKNSRNIKADLLNRNRAPVKRKGFLIK